MNMRSTFDSGTVKSWQNFFARDIIIAFVLCIVTAVIFGELAHEVVDKKEDVFDSKIFLALDPYISPRHTSLAIVISFFGTGSFLIQAYLVIIIFLFKKGKKKYGIHVFVSSISSLLLGLVLKEIFRRPRPALEHLDAAGGYSFPSAHTLGGFTFCGIMIYLVMQMRLSLAVKIILAITLFLFACLIGISRIYLHTHYASDTLASLCAAIFWLGLFYILAIVRDKKYFTIS